MKIEEIQKALEKAEADNKVLKALSEMNDSEKEFYKSLSDADKTAFIAKDAAARKEQMGDKFKKSLSADDAEAITKKLETIEKAVAEKDAEIAKGKDEIKKRDDEIAKLKGKVEDADLRAEVEKKYPHSKGTTEEKMAVLKSIKAMPDESVRKSMTDSLDAAEAAMADLAKEKGTSGGDKTGDAKDQLDALAKGIAEKDKGLTKEQAFAKALETPEGRKLYAELGK